MRTQGRDYIHGCSVCGGPRHDFSECPPERIRRQHGALWSFDGTIHVFDGDSWCQPIDMKAAQDLFDARRVFREQGGVDPPEPPDDPNWYWRMSVALLRTQVNQLQKRGSEIVMRNQALRLKELALEEVHRENSRLVERVVLLERVVGKAQEKLDGHDVWASDYLTEVECYVVEAIDNPPVRLPKTEFKCDGCHRVWEGAFDNRDLPHGRCPHCGSAFWIQGTAPRRASGTGKEAS